MADIIDPKWSENDALNNSASPDGWQNSYLANTIGPTGQSMMGALKRFYNQINAIYTTTGSANGYVLTLDKPLSGYSKGIQYAFWANHTNTGPATLNISALGSKAIVRNDGGALVAGQITSGIVVIVVYDGTNFRIQNLTTNPTFAGTISGNGSGLTDLNASAISTGTLADARLPTTLSAKTMAGSLNVQSGTAGVNGSIVLISGDPTNTGYIEFRQKDGSRAGFIGYAHTTISKRLSLATENGYSFDFSGSLDPTVNGNKIWHAGNDGLGSVSDSDLLDGMQSSVASTASTIVARDATGAINARDGIFSRTANTGFTYFGSNFANYIGSDGVNIVTNGLPFKVTGNSSVTGNHSVVGEITSTSGNFVTQGQSAAANAHYWYKSNLGVNRAVEYHSPSDSTWNLQLYNTAGASVRAISYRQSDGQLSFGGFLAASGAVYAGSSQHTTEGNLTFNGGMAGFGPDLYNALNARIKNDGGWYGINITGTANVAGVAATLRQSGTGAGMTFNWSGQAGQPSWLWGGSDGANMYVYNPSNFSVNYAATANNATYLGGENANQYSRVSYSTNINETNFPLGAYRIGLYSLNTNRIHDVNLRLYTDTRIYHAGGGGGALLAGTWRACGCIEGNNGVFLYQRVG